VPIVAIPGLREAVEQEQSIRLGGFFGVPVTLCGEEVNPLTPRHVIELEHCGSPFIVGGDIRPEDIAQLVWCVSVERAGTAPDLAEPAKFGLAARLGSLPYDECVGDCRAFYEDAMMDAPSIKASGVPHVSWAAGLVDLIASQYGWDEGRILNTPLLRLWQYRRAIIRRMDPAAILWNRSDSVKTRYLESLAT
jgi:hypothetical protein